MRKSDVEDDDFLQNSFFIAIYFMLQEYLKCRICGEIFNNPVAITPCGHVFCRTCIASVIEHGMNCINVSTNKNIRSAKSAKTKNKKNCCPICLGPAFLWTLTRTYLLERILNLYSEHVSKQHAQNCEEETQYLPMPSHSFVQPYCSEVPLGQLGGVDFLNENTGQVSNVRNPSASMTENLQDTPNLHFHDVRRPETEKKGFFEWSNRNHSLFDSLEEASDEKTCNFEQAETSIPSEKISQLSELVRIIEEEDRILSQLRRKMKMLANVLESKSSIPE